MSLRHACFTIFFPNDHVTAYDTATGVFKNLDPIRYAIWQLERCPDTDRIHVQGYLELNGTKRLAGVKKLFWCDSVHVEKRRGTRLQAKEYCSKEDTKVQGPWEYGKWINGPGERSDLHAIAEAITDGADLRIIDSEFPEQAAKYNQWVRRMISYERQKNLQVPQITLRPWQEDLVQLLSTPPHPRQILWYWDPNGNAGKTTFARWLMTTPLFTKRVAYFRGGKHADVAYAYDYEDVVVFDYCRDSIEFISYSVLEHLKDGMIFSTKYESTRKIFNPPHVLVFANQEPNRSKLSLDRWNVHQILTFAPNQVC